MSLPPSNIKLLRLRSLKPPHLKPKTLPRLPMSTQLPKLQPRVPQPGGGASEELIQQLSLRVAELEAEAANRREFDDAVLKTLEDVMEIALTTEHYFAIEGPTLTIKTGDSKIVLKPNGDITIDGKNIRVKGSGEVDIKGSKISQN